MRSRSLALLSLATVVPALLNGCVMPYIAAEDRKEACQVAVVEKFGRPEFRQGRHNATTRLERKSPRTVGDWFAHPVEARAEIEQLRTQVARTMAWQSSRVPARPG